MTTTWRARDSRGHYLASKDVHTTLGPEDWDDTCRHQADAPELQPSGETFGHEPVALDAVIHDAWTRHSACQACRARTTPMVCARCMEFDANGMWIMPAHPVHWPCTSAIVLGLEPRPAVSSAP
jgi:hypothetical protein